MANSIENDKIVYSAAEAQIKCSQNFKDFTKLEIKVLEFCIKCQFSEEVHIRDYIHSIQSLTKHLGKKNYQQISNIISSLEKKGVLYRKREGQRQKIIVRKRGVYLYVDFITKDMPKYIQAFTRDLFILNLTNENWDKDTKTQNISLSNIQEFVKFFISSELGNTIVPRESISRLPQYIVRYFCEGGNL